MIDGFMRVLAHASRAGTPRNECFNLGHPEPISIRELAAAMLRGAQDVGLVGAPLPVIADGFVYSQGFDDRWHRMPDITHASQTLGFAPTVSLRAGLARTLAYYHSLRQGRAHEAVTTARNGQPAPTPATPE